MLKEAKILALRGLESMGAFRFLAQSAWRKDRLLVLCYHGISQCDEHEWSPALYLSPELFEARLRILAGEGYKVLPLGEAMERLRAKSLPPRSVVITFDDGFSDFHSAAFPLLLKYGFPATVYLTTYYVHLGRPVFNLIVPYMLWRQRERGSGPNPALGWDEPPDLATAGGREKAWAPISMIAASRNLSGAARDDLAAEVAAHLGVDYRDLQKTRLLGLMNTTETAEVARRGIDIELHTHRHRTPEDAGLFLREISENRSNIMEITGRRADHFCYPSGVHRARMLPLLRQTEVLSATTCEPGMALASADPLLTPRLLDQQDMPELVFRSWLSGMGELIPKRSPER